MSRFGQSVNESVWSVGRQAGRQVVSLSVCLSFSQLVIVSQSFKHCVKGNRPWIRQTVADRSCLVFVMSRSTMTSPVECQQLAR